MERVKGAPTCTKCRFFLTCNDEEKNGGHYCFCYELGEEFAYCYSCKQFYPISEFRRNSHQKNGYSTRCKQCERKKENSESGRYKSYKKNAKQRGIDFELSKEEFSQIIKDRCYYCGEYGNPYNGVDRVDNNNGYSLQNCVPCCEWCNKIKMSHTIEEMMDHIKKIYECMVG